MSRLAQFRFQSRQNAARVLWFVAALLAPALASTAGAQYVGRVNTNQNNQPTLRAIAVLEYTGDLDHPTASRLVPIAVWDGENYQPGGQYLAQPIPLTVQTGTQYVLQVAGDPKGFFDVKAASNANGSWIAIGDYQKPNPPHYAKLRRSRIAPIMFGSGGDTTPHFAHVPTGDTSQGAAKTTTTAQNGAPSSNSGGPTLHRRTGDSSSGDSGSQNTADAPSNAPPIDPDRPIMREPSAPSPAGNTASASASESPETATTATDPNRPHFEYGATQDLQTLDKETKIEIAKLSGHPQHLEQIVAVSDAVNRPVHSYVYSWPDSDEEAKIKSALESIAQHLLAQSAQPPSAPRAVKTAVHHSAHRTASKKPVKPALPELTSEQFKAYQLSYGGGATLVFSAATGQGDSARYITIIAEPDFSGTPIVLFKSITSWPELNFIPRMKLIDAVDTNANNRAELIFALESQTSRTYAIYSVENNTVQQLFPMQD
ncbi:MAG TPA: hypothetical protein VME86_15865 [Acidobacteriaceae bacterium]|nr:hypothetical protein [Acidobacteriaceae bacterium]